MSGEETKRPCPRCGQGSWHNDRKEKWFCFHCNRGGTLTKARTGKPERKTASPRLGKKEITLEPLSNKAREFLKKFPEAPVDCFRTVHLSWGEYLCSSSAWVLKPLNKETCNPLTLTKGNELLRAGELAIVVEDFISGLVLWNLGYSVLILHGTNLQNPELLIGFDRIVLWTDPDKPGYKATRKLGLSYGWVSVRSDKDPKYYTSQEINQYLENL